MSESAGKTFRGLQEAYASIYANKSENLTEETAVDAVDELQEDYVINEEVLHETMVNYLIHFGYASDEKKAEAILPHMGERWTNTFALDYALAENFEYCVEYLIQEGCDFSSTTWDELYETYVNGYKTQNLHEVAPAIAAATAPAWMPYAAGALTALGGAYMLNKKKADEFAANQVQRASDFVMQMAKGKRRQSRDRRAEAAERLRQQQQQAAQPQQPQPQKPQQPQPQQPQQTAQTSGTGSTSQGSSGSPQPPKGPNRAQRWWNDITSGARQEIDRRAAERAANQAARASQPAQPNPFLQSVGRKAVTALDWGAKGALGLGVGGLIDQGLMGGLGGKVLRDVTTGSRKLGQKYDELMGRGKKDDKPKPAPLDLTPQGTIRVR